MKLPPQGHGSGPGPNERRSHVRPLDSRGIRPGGVLGREAGPAGGNRAPDRCAELGRRRGMCVFKSDSDNTVRNVVDGQTSKISKNEFYAIDEGGALGLPA